MPIKMLDERNIPPKRFQKFSTSQITQEWQEILDAISRQPRGTARCYEIRFSETSIKKMNCKHPAQNFYTSLLKHFEEDVTVSLERVSRKEVLYLTVRTVQ
jgi:hypothetical protein